MSDRSTIFAVLTPPGSAAIATIAVAGSGAWDLVSRSFRPATSRPSQDQINFHHFEYGRFGDSPGDAVIIAVRPSAVGVCVEIHCHGGPEVVQMIVSELARLGATQADAASLFGLFDLPTLAQVELTRAPTLRTAGILLDQWSGAFSRSINEIEAALAGSHLAVATRLIADLALHSNVGRHLTRPWRIVVAGAPNVGKSSLVNALAGYQRCVVTQTPGTTRDVVTTSLAIDGWPVELIDTAGQHATGDTLEEQGIARGRLAVSAADLCLWVADATAEPIWPDRSAGNLIRVINKSDLLAVWDVGTVTDGVVLSARTGFGVADLCGRISLRLVPDAPPTGAAVPFTSSLADMIDVMAKANAAGDIMAIRRVIASLTSSAQSAPSA